MDGKPRAIIAGTGFGCRIQLPALRAAGFDVVAMVGQDPARTAERAQVNGVPQAYTDLDLAISAAEAELVAISAPPHQHAPLAMKALERGCHVLCEKPFAADLREAEILVDAARKSGKVHRMGHELRFEPLRATIAVAIAQGLIGEPLLANVTLLLPQLRTQEAEMPGWWFDPAEGGGWLGAMGSHFIDQLRCWLGEFDSVSASFSRIAATRGAIDDSFSIRFRTTGGAEGLLQSSAGAWGPPLDIARVCGSKGTLWIEKGKVLFSGPSGDREISVPPEMALPPLPPLNTDPRHASERWRGLVAIELAPYIALCKSLRAAIDGAPAIPAIVPATFEDGLACMQAMDAIRTSAREGGRLARLEHQDGAGVAGPARAVSFEQFEAGGGVR